MHPTVLAKAEAMNGESINFSQKILSGIKYRIFPIELLRMAGVSPFQNPFTPCCFNTILLYPFIFSKIFPLILGERMMAILKTSKGWKIVETMSPDVNPIPLCIILFLELEGLVRPGIFGFIRLSTFENAEYQQERRLGWVSTIPATLVYTVFRPQPPMSSQASPIFPILLDTTQPIRSQHIGVSVFKFGITINKSCLILRIIFLKDRNQSKVLTVIPLTNPQSLLILLTPKTPDLSSIPSPDTIRQKQRTKYHLIFKTSKMISQKVRSAANPIRMSLFSSSWFFCILVSLLVVATSASISSLASPILSINRLSSTNWATMFCVWSFMSYASFTTLLIPARLSSISLSLDSLVVGLDISTPSNSLALLASSNLLFACLIMAEIPFTSSSDLVMSPFFSLESFSLLNNPFISMRTLFKAVSLRSKSLMVSQSLRSFLPKRQMSLRKDYFCRLN